MAKFDFYFWGSRYNVSITMKVKYHKVNMSDRKDKAILKLCCEKILNAHYFMKFPNVKCTRDISLDELVNILYT